jgi:hypothetical protein
VAQYMQLHGPSWGHTMTLPAPNVTLRSAEEWAVMKLRATPGISLARIIEMAQADALKAAVEACRNQRSDGRYDFDYNMAVDHCAAVIESLIPSPTTQKETTT